MLIMLQSIGIACNIKCYVCWFFLFIIVAQSLVLGNTREHFSHASYTHEAKVTKVVLIEESRSWKKLTLWIHKIFQFSKHICSSGKNVLLFYLPLSVDTDHLYMCVCICIISFYVLHTLLLFMSLLEGIYFMASLYFLLHFFLHFRQF